MSTLGDLEQYPAMDSSDPLKGLYCPSTGLPLASGEQLSDDKQNAKPAGDLDQTESFHSGLASSSVTEQSKQESGDLDQNKSFHSGLAGSSITEQSEQESGGLDENESFHSGVAGTSITQQSDQESDDSSSNYSCPAGSYDSSIYWPPVEEEEDLVTWDLWHAICKKKWNGVKAILDAYPDSLTTEISYKGRTALHVAAMFGQVTIVEELLKALFSPEFLTCLDHDGYTPLEFLTCRDHDGYTPLSMASTYSGSTQVAECLVEKNKELPRIPNNNGCLPVVQAFENNYIDMGCYLYRVTPLECLIGRQGSQLLYFCFKALCFDISLDLLQRCEELLLVAKDEEGWSEDEERWTPIHGIASLNTIIPNSSELVFWKRWIYHYINTPSTQSTNHISVDIQQEDKGKLTHTGHGLLAKLINAAYNFAGVNKIAELKLLKLQHAQADALVDLVCKNARNAYQEGIFSEALKLAAKEGNANFILKVSNVFPERFTTKMITAWFIEALDHRQVEVFNLIHGFQFKEVVMNCRSDGNTTVLHKAALKAPDHILNRIYAPTLQVQRELQWFKEVQSLTPPKYRGFQNSKGQTAEEVFRESHQGLLKEGEKWIKKTASSCSVVGALIVTMMFAAAFTGRGNNQNLGSPLFIKQPFFRVFIFATILSLVSSTTSVLMFLAILTSQYSEGKFLESLPRKLIWGLSFLFISVVCMMIAFLSTIYLMLKHTHLLWSILPIIILASVPIFLFVRSQFPLLLHTYHSTYVNIFDKKVDPWP